MAEKIILISGDGEEFSVDKAVALKIVENGDSADEGIPIPQVTGEILGKLIEYLKKHVSSDDEDLKKWDADFINVEKETLFGILTAAKNLKIGGLVELGIQTVVDTIENFNVEEIRTYFNLENDFTPEETAEMEDQYLWSFK